MPINCHVTRYKVESLWVDQKWFISYVYFLEEYIWPKCVSKDYFYSKWQNSLKNINNSPKATGNKAQATKLMMPALNITINYVRPTKIFHNTTIILWFMSVTSPVTSKVTWKFAVSQKRWPSPWNFVMKFYIWHERVHT